MIKQTPLTKICPLCQSTGKPFYKNTFFLCSECAGIFQAKEFLPNPEFEKSRYEMHHNNPTDLDYQKFVSPITKAIVQNYTVDSLGLDFGSGNGSSVSQVLEDQGFIIKQFDPFFKNFPKLLQNKYDYIVCCEVIEHFHTPQKEFNLLKNLLNKNGRLYCMTHIYTPDIDFDTWYYKNDVTHVFIYQKATLEWIKTHFQFSSISIENRLIIFTN